MSNKASRTFTSAFKSAMSETALQVARQPELVKRMTTGASVVFASLAIALTVAPPPAAAQNNQVMRTAADAFAGIVGGAIGSQFGGGNGKKAAAAAGVAAGVWAAEALQQQESMPVNRSRGSRDIVSIGPVISSGWSNTRVPGADASGFQGRTVERQVLQSGTTQIGGDRVAKLVALERTFLAARDSYARSIYAADLAVDDSVLDPDGRGVQQQLAATRAQQRKSQSDFESARSTFVNAVEHMGSRGYDVHDFAYSHKLAQSRVTAGDMRRGDVERVTRGVRTGDDYKEGESVRGESYSSR